MKILKSICMDEHIVINVSLLNKCLIVNAMNVYIGDECLIIGKNNDVHNSVLTDIKSAGADNNGPIYNIYFDDMQMISSCPFVSSIKVFGVYEQ